MHLKGLTWEQARKRWIIEVSKVGPYLPQHIIDSVFLNQFDFMELTDGEGLNYGPKWHADYIPRERFNNIIPGNLSELRAHANISIGFDSTTFHENGRFNQVENCYDLYFYKDDKPCWAQVKSISTWRNSNGVYGYKIRQSDFSGIPDYIVYVDIEDNHMFMVLRNYSKFNEDKPETLDSLKAKSEFYFYNAHLYGEMVEMIA